jgi:hypothetical protein
VLGPILHVFLCHINDLPDSVTFSIKTICRWLFAIQDNQNSKRPPKTASRLRTTWNMGKRLGHEI